MVDIQGYWELLALHKAIMEAKFGQAGKNEIIASPFLASAARKILRALIEEDKVRVGVDKVSQWDSWRMIDENRREWGLLLKIIDADERYKTLDHDDFAREIRDVLSPLEISDEKLRNLIETKVKK